MNIEKFGEFLIRVTNGKVTSDDVKNALLKQMKFSDGYKKLGEILVDEKIITNDELEDFLERFDKEKIIKDK